MHARTWPLLIVLGLAAHARAQESVRNLSGPGQHNAFLTAGQIDRWIFDGDKGETIIAHVSSKEFDPILQLAKTGAKDDDKVLVDVDDLGNESRFTFRLPESGQYKIRVHAFKFQGGGNYTLRVQRFQAKPLVVGKPVLGTFDREGNSYHYFQAAKDKILIPELKGTSPDAWTLLDVKGRATRDWLGTALIEEAGECYLIVTGQPDLRYDLLVREAKHQPLTEGKGVANSLQQGELEVLEFQGQPGEFRLFEVEKKGELQARLKYAPLEKKDETKLGRRGDRPEIALLPVASRGGRLRFAAILGRAGRYQLQLLAATPASYQATVRDPSTQIEWSKEAAGNLPVGGAGFYTIKAVAGQLFQASLASDKFVPVLRLIDVHGNLIAGGDDRITHMVVAEGLYRLQVSSLGDGGGGDFRLTLTETKLKEIQVGGREKGAILPGVTDFWAFPGKEGQTVFLSVRSAAFEPTVSLRSPDGVRLVADNRGSAGAGSLFAITLPKTGRYTLWISSRRGAGDYAVRLIDGD